MDNSINDINPTGIPKTPFVEDVDTFMKDKEQTADKVLQTLEENHQKYKFMETNLSTKKKRLQQKLPDIKATLDIIKFMKNRQLMKLSGDKPLKMSFMLSDNVYAKASIAPDCDKICLWLGANVMLEYNLDEAEVLLQKNSDHADKNSVIVDEQIAFIRDQLTTIEVNMARIYNWDVKRRQELGLIGK